jgi:hypothetical protein
VKKVANSTNSITNDPRLRRPQCGKALPSRSMLFTTPAAAPPLQLTFASIALCALPTPQRHTQVDHRTPAKAREMNIAVTLQNGDRYFSASKVFLILAK